MKLNITTLTDAILDISYGEKNGKAITVNISSAQYNLEWIIYNINKQNEDCKNIYTPAIISYNNIILTKKNIEDCIFIGPNGIIIKFIVNELYKDNITITATVGDNIKCKEIKFDDLIILPHMENKKIKQDTSLQDDRLKEYKKKLKYFGLEIEHIHKQNKQNLTLQQKIELRKHALNIALNITIQLKTSRTTLHISELIDKAENILQWIIKDI